MIYIVIIIIVIVLIIAYIAYTHTLTRNDRSFVRHVGSEHLVDDSKTIPGFHTFISVGLGGKYINVKLAENILFELKVFTIPYGILLRDSAYTESATFKLPQGSYVLSITSTKPITTPVITESLTARDEDEGGQSVSIYSASTRDYTSFTTEVDHMRTAIETIHNIEIDGESEYVHLFGATTFHGHSAIFESRTKEAHLHICVPKRSSQLEITYPNGKTSKIVSTQTQPAAYNTHYLKLTEMGRYTITESISAIRGKIGSFVYILSTDRAEQLNEIF